MAIDYSEPKANVMRPGAPVPLIEVKDMTAADMITDVGWLSGEIKERAQGRYLALHGQYFDSGVRHTNG